MRLLLLSDKTSPYTRALLEKASQRGLRFDHYIALSKSWHEKAHLLRVIIKRAGLMALPYYLSERGEETAHVQQRLGKQALTAIPFDHMHTSSGLNSAQTLDLIKTIAPDIIVLGHVGIAGDTLLSLAKQRVINAHTAILPDYRGYADPAHMVLDHDLNAIGVTVHWVIRQVDAGAILKTALYRGTKPPNLSALLGELRLLAAETLVDQLCAIRTSAALPEGTVQDIAKGKKCFLLSADKRRKAEALYRSLPTTIFN